MKKVLITATVLQGHILVFHIPTLKMFKDMGYETYVAAKNDLADPQDVNIPYCDHYLNIPFERSPFSFRNVSAYRQLKALIDTEKFDMVHCHTPVGSVVTRLACRKARKNGTKVVYTAHGFHFYKGAPIINRLLYYPVEKLCSRMTDVLITINREDNELAKRKMKAKLVEYVPGVGVDLDRFVCGTTDVAEKRRELGIPEDACVLLSVGELNQNKNHETVIRAVADSDLFYLIAGEGDLRESHIRLIEELGAADRIKLLGFRTDVGALCEASDVFVFPSLREGLPVSVMEAMACGKPCVASRIRGNTDLIDEDKGGILCSPDDTEGFRKAILKLASDRDLRQSMGEYNAEKVKSFGLEAVTASLRGIYEKIL